MKHKKDLIECNNYSAYGPRGKFLVTFKTNENRIKPLKKGLTEVIKKLNKNYSRSYVISADFSDLEPPKPPYVKGCVEVTGDYRALSGVDDYLRQTENLTTFILYPQVKHNKHD